MFGKLLFETCLHVLDWSDLTERSNSVFFLPSKCDFQRLFRAFFDTLVVGLLTLVSAWFLYKIAKTRWPHGKDIFYIGYLQGFIAVKSFLELFIN